MAKAEQEGFDVLVTYDQGLAKQNVIKSEGLTVFVLKPEGQGVKASRALIGNVLLALTRCKPGEVLTFSNRTGGSS